MPDFYTYEREAEEIDDIQEFEYQEAIKKELRETKRSNNKELKEKEAWNGYNVKDMRETKGSGNE